MRQHVRIVTPSETALFTTTEFLMLLFLLDRGSVQMPFNTAFSGTFSVSG